MFFVLSKVFWILAQPSHWLGFLVLATAILLVLRWNRAARFCGIAAVLLLVLAGFLAVPLARDLEDRYPRPPWPAHVDGILVLGSGFDTALFRARGAPASNEGIWRVEAGFAAARRYPGARLVFSGGSGALGGAPFSEAETAYSKSAQLKPDYEPALVNLGRVRIAVKNFPGAIEVLDRAVKNEPTSPEANYFLGEAYLQARLGSKAVPYLDEAIKLSPDTMAEAHLRLAALYNAKGLKQKAADEYAAFLKQRPNYPDRKKLEAFIKAAKNP